MPKFSSRRFVPFSPRQMFDLVADVERYPEFLPLCESLIVTERTRLGDTDVLIAIMGIGYKSIKERFATRVTIDERQPSIMVEYIDGPFHHLENRWQFHVADGGTQVDFYIDYEFRSRTLAVLMGSLFDHAFRRFTEAFDARARTVYGAPSQVADRT